MSIMLKQLLLVLLLTACSSKAANILALLGLASPSHHIWNRSLMMALAARGHNVTVFSTDEEKNPPPNYTQFIIDNAYFSEDDIEELTNVSPFTVTDTFIKFNFMMCDNLFSGETTKNFLKLAKNTKFDAIVVDITAVECILGFVHAFNSPPLIGMTAYSHPLWVSYMTGNPHNPAYIPEVTTSFSAHMSFWQRLWNTLYHLYSVFRVEWSYLPEVDKMVREYLGEGVPAVLDIRNNISLVMVNTHVSFDQPRPLVPAIVEVGGMHIGQNKTLPEHLKIPMDEAKEGFIYFSLGSNLRSDKMPAERRQVFLDAFSRLPYKVFWKWESDSLPGQPSNVVLGKWMPQRDILAHPNIVLFITHNGLLSTQEAVYDGVPTIGVPFFADQVINAAKSKAQGIGESIDYATVTSEELLRTIQKVAKDRRYKENARRLSKLMKDQPQSPLERAVFWTEYVIRHKGAPHLRSAAADLPLYQYLLLDVVCVLAASVLVVLLLLYRICCAVLSMARSGGRAGKQKTH